MSYTISSIPSQNPHDICSKSFAFPVFHVTLYYSIAKTNPGFSAASSDFLKKLL